MSEIKMKLSKLKSIVKPLPKLEPIKSDVSQDISPMQDSLQDKHTTDRDKMLHMMKQLKKSVK